METKIVSEYEYLGLGFSIILKDVVFLKIREQWHPKINVEKVAEDAFHSLNQKANSSRLTENESKFIQFYSNSKKEAAFEEAHPENANFNSGKIINDINRTIKSGGDSARNILINNGLSYPSH